MRSLLLLPLLSMIAIAETKSSPAGSGDFPVLEGRNLQKTNVTLPQELPGQLNLIILGFVRDHQTDIDTWIPHGEALERTVEGFRFFEVPFLEGKYRLFRFWIDGGMRKGIPDEAARERTITVYGGRRDAMNQLEVADLGKIHLFLITPAGRIVWRSEGRWSEEKNDSLTAAVAASLSALGRLGDT